MATIAQKQFGIGSAVPRIDARAKVTGEARYGSDVAVASPVFAYLVTSTIARGRISAIDDREARAVPGVVDLLTHEHLADAIKPMKSVASGGYVGSSIVPLASEQVYYAGQIVAVVLAESFEAARDAANRVNVSYVA